MGGGVGVLYRNAALLEFVELHSSCGVVHQHIDNLYTGIIIIITTYVAIDIRKGVLQLVSKHR